MSDIFLLFNHLVKFLKSKIETAQDGDNACVRVLFLPKHLSWNWAKIWQAKLSMKTDCHYLLFPNCYRLAC